MKRKALILGAAILAATAVTVAAVAVTTGEDPVATPTPKPERFDEKEWVIDVPDGWQREVITPDADAKKAIRYTGPNGEYFIVAIDPLGSGLAYDALWRYKVKGDRFTIVDTYDCTSADDQDCIDDDDRFDAYILWEAGADPVKVGGHTWYFLFGNTQDAQIDADVFEGILESVRVTA